MKCSRITCFLACIVFGTTNLMANPAILEVAKSFGSRQIVFVARHIVSQQHLQFRQIFLPFAGKNSARRLELLKCFVYTVYRTQGAF
jgi:hypothetical protein